MRVDVHVCQMRSPGDVSEIARLFDRGTVSPESVVALVGKSEGIGAAEVGDRLCIVLSGGSPGVITPHVAVFSRTEDQTPATSAEPRLVAGLAHSADILPEEIGRMGQITKVRLAVEHAMADAGAVDPSDVHAVLVKAPSLSSESISEARTRGHDTVTHDVSIGPEGAICYSNDASALGVALALGEADDLDVHDDMVRRDYSVFSDVALTSSGGEKTHAEVLLLGNALGSTSTLRIGHRSMRSIIDGTAVRGALESAGVAVVDGDTLGASRNLVYALAKMIMPATAELAGRRITLLEDQVGYHVAKAMGGFLLASTTGRTEVFVSGGEHNSHQGPPDGNPLAVLVRTQS